MKEEFEKVGLHAGIFVGYYWNFVKNSVAKLRNGD